MKQIIILVGAIAFVCVLVVASLLTMMPLGIIVDTNTKGYSWCGDDPVVGLTTPELCGGETELVTAWKSGANSVKMVITGNVKFPNCNGWGLPEFSPIRYYYKIYLTDQVYTDYCIMDGDTYDRNIIHIEDPSTGFFGRKYFSGINYAWKDAPLWKEDGSILTDSYKHGVLGLCGRFTSCTGDSYGLELKGPHVGKLTVEFWVEVHCQWLGNVHGQPIRFQKDEVRLLDGTGSIEVLPRGSMDPGASGYYVFEEGDDVTFEMDTGFSGKRQGGDVSSQGWELRVYNPSSERVKTWTDIPDDRRGYEKTFTIPEGSWNAQGSNQWKVELYNSLFKQDEKDFFTVDCIDKIPGTPVISFDKVAYDQGDTCIATATAEGNPSTGLGIYEFRIKAYYQGTIDYLYDEYVAAYSMGGNQYSASASFTMTRGDRYVVVESQAFDARHDVGGRPSFAGKNTVWVRDKDPEPDTFVLDVYVRDEDKDLVEGATVDCGIKTTKTSADGKASFIGLPKDTYEVKANKEGVGSGKETVVLDSDKAITIYLTGDGEIPYLAIIVAIIVFCISIVAAIFVPGGIYVKLLVVILGAVLAVIVYFLLSGAL